MLTEEEKRFINNILKFGNYGSGTGNGVVKYIVKRGYWLYFCFSPFHSNAVYIDKELYFRGMQDEEEYTLKELGLQEEKEDE